MDHMQQVYNELNYCHAVSDMNRNKKDVISIMNALAIIYTALTHGLKCVLQVPI